MMLQLDGTVCPQPAVTNINADTLARQLTGEIDAFPQSEGNRQFHFNRITCVIVI